jgi:hypothetical protein
MLIEFDFKVVRVPMTHCNTLFFKSLYIYTIVLSSIAR